MTHFSDELRIGKVFNPKFIGATPLTFVSDRPIPDLGPGVVQSPVNVYTIVPLALATNNIAASQTPGAAGNLTLTAGTGNTAATIFGVAAVKLDVPRAVKITSAANDSARTFTITGYDLYGQVQTEAVTGPTTNVTGKKTWLYITQIAVDAATAGAITIGTSDVFGLPYAVTDKGLLSINWNNTLAVDASTVVVADGTSPATSSTGDVRGTVTPSAGASDGAKRLVVRIVILDPDTTLGLYGVVPA